MRAGSCKGLKKRGRWGGEAESRSRCFKKGSDGHPYELWLIYHNLYMQKLVPSFILSKQFIFG